PEISGSSPSGEGRPVLPDQWNGWMSLPLSSFPMEQALRERSAGLLLAGQGAGARLQEEVLLGSHGRGDRLGGENPGPAIFKSSRRPERKCACPGCRNKS